MFPGGLDKKTVLGESGGASQRNNLRLSRERQLPKVRILVRLMPPLPLPVTKLVPLLQVEAALREDAVEEAEEEDECGEAQWVLQGRRDGWKQMRRKSSADVAAECRSVKECERPVLYKDDRPTEDLSKDALPRVDLPSVENDDSSSSSSKYSSSSSSGCIRGEARDARSSATRAAASSPAVHMSDSSLRARLKSRYE